MAIIDKFRLDGKVAQVIMSSRKIEGCEAVARDKNLWMLSTK